MPKMGDYFLAQMGDFYIEDVCFDIPRRGRGSVGLALPHSAKVSVG
jgi:hypothetical protein